MKQATNQAPKPEVPSIKEVVCWERVEDFEHGMDANDNFLGWMKLVGSDMAWHITDNKRVVSI